jgi:hypothetical protein
MYFIKPERKGARREEGNPRQRGIRETGGDKEMKEED